MIIWNLLKSSFRSIPVPAFAEIITPFGFPLFSEIVHDNMLVKGYLVFFFQSIVE
jgi:hypothetical protein